MGLKDKLLKSSTISDTALLEESKVFEKKDQVVTKVPAINIALSAKPDGGMMPGLLQIAGESKRFKTKFALLMGEAFLEKYDDGVILFYDSEFGSPASYFNQMETDRIIHSPVVDIEQLKQDIIHQIDQVESDDHLMIIVDSIGNLASKKEVDDAREQKTAVDMTRAKQIKSLFRIVGPRLVPKNIYMIVINHIYQSQDMFPQDVVAGGKGTIYNSNDIWIIGAEKIKDERELIGFDFKVKIEKSRTVKQGSMVPITVNFDSGIDKWSGMLDLAEEAGYVTRPTKQTYALASESEKTYKRKEILNNDDFFNKLLESTDFSTWVEKRFAYGS